MKLSVQAARHETAMARIQDAIPAIAKALKIEPPTFTRNKDREITDLFALEALAEWLGLVAAGMPVKKARKAE